MINKNATKLSLSAVLLLVLTAFVSTFGCSDDPNGGKVKPAKEWDHSYFKSVTKEACEKQVKCGVKDDQNQPITKEYCDAQITAFDSEEAKTGFSEQVKTFAACDGGLECCLSMQLLCVTACTKNLSCDALTAAQKNNKSADNDPALKAEADEVVKCVNSCVANDRCPDWSNSDPDTKGN